MHMNGYLCQIYDSNDGDWFIFTLFLVLISSLHRCDSVPSAPSVANTVGVEPRSGATVRYSNARPRRDVHGDIMDAHDGNYVWSEDAQKWYYFAMGYGKRTSCVRITHLYWPSICPHTHTHSHI